MATHDDALEWRTIPDFPDYQASNRGQIRRATPPRDGRAPTRPLPYEITPKKNAATGYMHVSVFCREKNKRVTKTIHRLVLSAFLGPCPEGKYGLHKDGDRKNNNIANLRWGTPLDNSDDAKKHGTWAHGGMLPHSKLTTEIVKDIRARDISRGDLGKIAKEFNVSKSVICEALSGKTWAHVNE